eukprot:6205843-Pleurochrysis_carterae.AAC.1
MHVISKLAGSEAADRVQTRLQPLFEIPQTVQLPAFHDVVLRQKSPPDRNVQISLVACRSDTCVRVK